MSVITLTTDFGTRDWFVGTMKGVVLSINPDARVVDLTHDIPAGDVPAGAFCLAAASGYFPEGTIHVAVVDPGVGGPRPAIAVKTKRFIFVGPDNGLLSFALRREKVRTVRLLQNSNLFLPARSRTFHGRDLFAPVAAHLSRGVRFSEVGPLAAGYVDLGWPEPEVVGGALKGEILHIDRFGNAITNIDQTGFQEPSRFHLRLRGRRLCAVEEFYGAVPPGQPVGVIGSSGLLEIAVNGGSAAQQLGLKKGDRITLESDTGADFNLSV